MPAPRLLDKKVISSSLAIERKQTIDKGLKLAKSVDAIREARIEEELKLEEFRRETIARVQVEIDAKIAERDSIARDIPKLKEERLLSKAPINLKEEWQRVREDKIANAKWQEQNTEQALGLLAREEDARQLADKLLKDEELIGEEHSLSLRTLSEAETKFSQASEALQKAESQAQEILNNAHKRENRAAVREEDSTLREIELSKREEQVEAHEVDLSNREIKLKSRQEIFIKAQAYIKSKK